MVAIKNSEAEMPKEVVKDIVVLVKTENNKVLVEDIISQEAVKLALKEHPEITGLAVDTEPMAYGIDGYRLINVLLTK